MPFPFSVAYFVTTAETIPWARGLSSLSLQGAEFSLLAWLSDTPSAWLIIHTLCLFQESIMDKWP